MRAASRHDYRRAASNLHPCYNHTLVMSVDVAPGKISSFGEGRQLKEKCPPFGVCGRRGSSLEMGGRRWRKWF